MPGVSCLGLDGYKGIRTAPGDEALFLHGTFFLGCLVRSKGIPHLQTPAHASFKILFSPIVFRVQENHDIQHPKGMSFGGVLGT